MIVHETDSRLFFSKKNFLKPLKSEFFKRSMIRGQNISPFYKIFSGEFFKHKQKFKIDFLGKKKRFLIAPKLTNFDIDEAIDLKILELLIKKSESKFKEYTHEK